VLHVLRTWSAACSIVSATASTLNYVGEEYLDAFREEKLITFSCECGSADCNAEIEMTLAERHAVDKSSAGWAIAPGHKVQVALGERVLERHERYWVVG
jgi:hypothetical protein